MAELPRRSNVDLGGRAWVRAELLREYPGVEIDDTAIDAAVTAAWDARQARTAQENRSAGGPWRVALHQLVGTHDA